MENKKRIVILGAGYAGLMTARDLAKKLRKDEAEITLVNKNDYHYESTWLHEVAGGTIKPEEATFKLEDVLDKSRVNIVIDEVVDINKEEKVVNLKSGKLEFDYLVVALGFTTNTFGIKGAEEHAYFIQDVNTALKIKEHIDKKFEEYAKSEEKKDEDLTVLVGGGGFTGIELIGELSLNLPKLAKKHGIDPSKVKIINIEASPSILGNFRDRPELQDYAREVLKSRNVEIKEATPIKEFTEEGVIIGEDEQLVKGGTIIWTGGVKANPIISTIGLELERGKVKITEDLRATGEENIFVLGDCAFGVDANGKFCPPTAQVATQHGKECAKNIAALIRNQPLTPFVFDDKGTVVSLGKTHGVGAIFSGIKIKGKTGAFMKKVVDNRSLYILGGTKILMKKGKF